MESHKPPWIASVPAPTAAHMFEEAGPMDLTKSSSNKASAPEKTSSNHPADMTDAQQSVHVPGTSVNKDRMLMPRRQPAVAETPILSTADAPVQHSQDFVPQKEVNLQAAHAAIQAQLRAQASPHAAQDPKLSAQAPPQKEVNLQAAHAAIQAQLHAQASPHAAQDPKYKAQGMALLRHFFPGYTAPPASSSPPKDMSPHRMTAPRFLVSPQSRMALSPHSVPSPPAMPTPRGMAPQLSVPSSQDGASLPRPPVASACGSTPSPAVPSPADASPASVSPMHLPAGGVAPSSACSALSPTGAVPPSSDAVVSLAGPALSLAGSPPSFPAQLTSPNASAASSPHPVVGSPRITVPNFLLPQTSEPSDGLRQQNQNLSAKPEGEKSRPHVNPLGGFAWHRPAKVDPFRAVQGNSSGQKNSTSTEAGPASLAVGSDAQQEQEKGREIAPEIDLSDQNLWQQQFLQTLREKRRQQQEQQQRQNQQQPQHQQVPPAPKAKDPPSRSQNYPSQRGRGRRKKPANAAEAATASANETLAVHAGISEASPSSSQRRPAGSGAANNRAEMNSVAPPLSTVVRGKASRGRSRGRSCGRPRKNASLPTPILVEEPGAEQGAEEEGAELQGFGVDVEVKVEPLEAGVRCGGCGKVFFNETDILEHDCDDQ